MQARAASAPNLDPVFSVEMIADSSSSIRQPLEQPAAIATSFRSPAGITARGRGHIVHSVSDCALSIRASPDVEDAGSGACFGSPQISRRSSRSSAVILRKVNRSVSKVSGSLAPPRYVSLATPCYSHRASHLRSSLLSNILSEIWQEICSGENMTLTGLPSEYDNTTRLAGRVNCEERDYSG